MQKYYFLISVLFFIGLLSWGFFIVRRYSKKKKLTENKKKEFNKIFKNIKSPHNNPKQKIIDYDKLYHKILLALNYEGSFGEILKKEPNEIGDLDKVWELHKLRNKLVHDFDLTSPTTLVKKSKEYEKQLNFILDQ